MKLAWCALAGVLLWAGAADAAHGRRGSARAHRAQPAPAQTTHAAPSPEQLERVRARIAALSQSIEQDRARHDALNAALEQSESAIQKAHADLQAANSEVEKQVGKARGVQQQHTELQRRIDDERAALAAQLRAEYEIGSNAQSQLAFDPEDPGRAGRLVTYYDYLNRARGARIGAIAVEQQHLAEIEQQYAAQISVLQQAQTQKQQAYAALQARRSERAEAVAALKQRLGDETEQLAQLQLSEKQIQSLLDSLSKALADAPPESRPDSRPFPQLRGRLSWPLRGPVLAGYGESKAAGHLQWKGLWIGADEGMPVHACARGRVAYVGWMSRYGLITVLEHDGGWFSLYGHAASVAKNAGDTVAAGDVIATAGSTGGYEQSGIYFEIRKGTEPVNPRDWLRK